MNLLAELKRRNVLRMGGLYLVGLAYQIAEAHALRGDADQTFAWLERAANNRDPGIAGLLHDPLLLRFAADPRFARMCRKVGLPTLEERDGAAKPSGHSAQSAVDFRPAPARTS